MSIFRPTEKTDYTVNITEEKFKRKRTRFQYFKYTIMSKIILTSAMVGLLRRIRNRLPVLPVNHKREYTHRIPVNHTRESICTEHVNHRKHHVTPDGDYPRKKKRPI
jgi:hypothetical protein